MRIGQLARRLGVTPTEILGFLGTQNVETEAGTNSRLSNDELTKVISHFAPGRLSEILQAPSEEPVATPVETPAQVPAPETGVTEIVIEKIAEEPVAEETQTELTPELPVEVIRVSKVELQGLKVLGKIDLPQPRKKEVAPETQQEPAEGSTETPQTQPVQQPRQEFRRRNERYDRPERRERDRKNPIELKREQEARKAEEKKRENAERQKEKRTNHYYSKVKSVPTKPARRYDEQTVIEDLDSKEPPKGILGRFFHWLRN